MPAWTPGKNSKGENMDVQMTLPINFVLSGIENPKAENIPGAFCVVAYPPKESSTNTPQGDVPYTVVEQMPEYEGGVVALNKFIGSNVKYPADAIEKGITGTVMVKFIVTKAGDIKDATVIRGISESQDKEAIRVVNSMPKWIPGKQKGIPVDVFYVLPIRYVLEAGGIKSKPNTTSPAQGDGPFTVVEQMPEFEGGQSALSKYISDNLKYPKDASEKGIQGMVVVRFIVTKTGDIKDATVIRGISESQDKEALRVVNSMPKWKPGKQKGVPVDVWYTIPFRFVLQI